MGILSRFFSKPDEAALKSLENLIETMKNRSDAEFVSLVGTEGKVKGLDILYSQRDGSSISLKEMRHLNGKLIEMYKRLNELGLHSAEEEMQKFELEYQNKKFCLFPIPGVSKFVLTAAPHNISKILKEMVNLRIIIFKLTEEREGIK